MTLTKHIACAAAFGAALLIGLQTANADPKTGKECHASKTGGDEILINIGTYNKDGECCSPRLTKAPPGVPLRTCLVCDAPHVTCADGQKEK
jgi:hypothetical protein